MEFLVSHVNLGVWSVPIRKYILYSRRKFPIENDYEVRTKVSFFGLGLFSRIALQFFRSSSAKESQVWRKKFEKKKKVKNLFGVSKTAFQASSDSPRHPKNSASDAVCLVHYYYRRPCEWGWVGCRITISSKISKRNNGRDSRTKVTKKIFTGGGGGGGGGGEGGCK